MIRFKIFGITLITVIMLSGCTVKKPTSPISFHPEKIDTKILKDKKIGILSNMQGILGVHYLQSQYQVKSIANWKLNEFVQEIIYKHMQKTYTNIKVVSMNVDVILLAEAYEYKIDLIKNIMKNEDIEFLILIDSMFNEGIGIELNYTYHSYNPFDDVYYDTGQIDFSIQLITLDKQNNPIVVAYAKTGSSHSMFYLTDKDKEKIISNEDASFVNKTLVDTLEPIYKAVIQDRIRLDLIELNLIN